MINVIEELDSGFDILKNVYREVEKTIPLLEQISFADGLLEIEAVIEHLKDQSLLQGLIKEYDLYEKKLP